MTQSRYHKNRRGATGHRLHFSIKNIFGLDQKDLERDQNIFSVRKYGRQLLKRRIS
jgi:hypothetical protein